MVRFHSILFVGLYSIWTITDLINNGLRQAGGHDHRIKFSNIKIIRCVTSEHCKQLHSIKYMIYSPKILLSHVFICQLFNKNSPEISKRCFKMTLPAFTPLRIILYMQDSNAPSVFEVMFAFFFKQSKFDDGSMESPWSSPCYFTLSSSTNFTINNGCCSAGHSSRWVKSYWASSISISLACSRSANKT